MGRIKDWLMDMENDAIHISDSEFIEKYGRENERIWNRVNLVYFRNSPDFYNTKDKLPDQNSL